MTLSDDAIDKLAQPIIDRQERINIYVILQIAERVKQIGTVIQTDLHRLEQLRKIGGDVKKINSYIAQLVQLQEEDIKSFIKNVAKISYSNVKPFYDYRHKPFIPFEKNTNLQKMVEAVGRQTANTYKNISKAQAFMIRDLQNPQILIPTSLSDTYQSVVDEAIQATQTGVLDYNLAMRRTMMQLVNSGLRRVTYEAESGRKHTQRLDTALRRNILDGVKAVSQQMNKITGEQFGANGVELSAHPMPAPDHELVQGRVFRNEEFEKMQNGESCVDIDGNIYAGFDRHIGTLNCKHIAWSVVVESVIPNYTDAQLKKFLVDNKKGFTLPNGKHLTLYQCTQLQRKMETEIRKAKEKQMTASKCGDTDMAKQMRAMVKKLTTEYKQFSTACKIQSMMNRTVVPGYSSKI